MLTVFKPPTPFVLDGRPSVFLAGSIEMGRAEAWQARVESALADCNAIVLNPRRDDWDASWEQTISDPQFRQQVEWELSGLERASVVAFYFAPDTKAPITLLELGLLARDRRAVTCCPDGYWRKGNVEVVCARYGVPLVDDLTALIAEVRRRLSQPPAGGLSDSR
jgi:hypothetical protein